MESKVLMVAWWRLQELANVGAMPLQHGGHLIKLWSCLNEMSYPTMRDRNTATHYALLKIGYA
jgi:hypothetical protein